VIAVALMHRRKAVLIETLIRVTRQCSPAARGA
jgi:hypothetical protein